MKWTGKSRRRLATFSVYPATARKIRSTSDHFGSVGRAVEVAVEILYERARSGELFEDEDDEVIDDLRGLPRGLPHGSLKILRDNLKVPFAFSILPRTERLVEFLAGPEFYKNKNSVIMFSGTLLPQLYSDFIGCVLTATERHERMLEFNATLDAKVEAIFGVEIEHEKKPAPTPQTAEVTARNSKPDHMNDASSAPRGIENQTP
jgi:hypothetical protein